MRPFETKVWGIVKGIQAGYVMTYGQVAKQADSPDAAQAVGNAMSKAKDEDPSVPWWRVVRADGVISEDAPTEQRELLRSEGVTFLSGDRIDLAKHQWRG